MPSLPYLAITIPCLTGGNQHRCCPAPRRLPAQPTQTTMNC